MLGLTLAFACVVENREQHKHDARSYVRPMKTLVPDSAHSESFVSGSCAYALRSFSLDMLAYGCACTCGYACVTSENQALYHGETKFPFFNLLRL